MNYEDFDYRDMLLNVVKAMRAENIKFDYCDIINLTKTKYNPLVTPFTYIKNDRCIFMLNHYTDIPKRNGKYELFKEMNKSNC